MSAGNCERGRSGEYYSCGYRYHYRLVCYGTISLSGFFLLPYTILTALFKLFYAFFIFLRWPYLASQFLSQSYSVGPLRKLTLVTFDRYMREYSLYSPLLERPTIFPPSLGYSEVGFYEFIHLAFQILSVFMGSSFVSRSAGLSFPRIVWILRWPAPTCYQGYVVKLMLDVATSPGKFRALAEAIRSFAVSDHRRNQRDIQLLQELLSLGDILGPFVVRDIFGFRYR